MHLLRVPIPVFRNSILDPQNPLLPGFLRIVVVVIAPVVAAAGRCGHRRCVHRPFDEPLHFFAVRGPMRNVRTGGPPSGILRGASSPPPLPPIADDDDQCSADAARDLSSGGGVRRNLLLYNSANQPTDQPSNPPTYQPTNPPILFFVQLIFQSRSYKFSTPNFPLTTKKVVKTTLCTTGCGQLPPKYPSFLEGVLELLCRDIRMVVFSK